MHIPGSGDAAVSSHSDAAPSFPPNDAGAPPPDCLAPCVWELVKDCLPPGPCVSQAYEPYSPLSYDDVICVPGTGWAATRNSTSFRVYGHSASVYIGDQFCYGFSTGVMDGVLSLVALRWWGGVGNAALMIGGRTAPGAAGIIGNTEWGPIACGSPKALAAYSQCASSGQCTGASGVTVYDVDPDQPHCAPWRDIAYAAYGYFDCKPGCCPG